MNLMNIMLDKSGLPQESLSMGGTLGLWEIARNKIITLPIYIIYSKQAKDKDLIKLTNRRISTLRKQIEKIQQLLKEHDFEAPMEPNWEKKLNNDAFVISGSILDDEEIAMGLKEHIRAVLSIETQALRNSTAPETRNLIFDMIKDGHADYGSLIKLMREKNWTDVPPTLIQH